MNRQFNPAILGEHRQVAAHMPPLIHKLPDEEFDIMKSEVVDWLCNQPECRQKLFDWYHDRGAIIFKNGKWQGVLYEK